MVPNERDSKTHCSYNMAKTAVSEAFSSHPYPYGPSMQYLSHERQLIIHTSPKGEAGGKTGIFTATTCTRVLVLLRSIEHCRARAVTIRPLPKRQAVTNIKTEISPLGLSLARDQVDGCRSLAPRSFGDLFLAFSESLNIDAALCSLATMDDRGDDQHFLIVHLFFTSACLSDQSAHASGSNANFRFQPRSKPLTLTS